LTNFDGNYPDKVKVGNSNENILEMSRLYFVNAHFDYVSVGSFVNKILYINLLEYLFLLNYDT
jgi:hypothetical protein